MCIPDALVWDVHVIVPDRWRVNIGRRMLSEDCHLVSPLSYQLAACSVPVVPRHKVENSERGAFNPARSGGMRNFQIALCIYL